MRDKLIKLNDFYASGATRPIAFRIEQLTRLRLAIRHRRHQIEQALLADLGKSPEESILTEISIITQEIELHIKNLRRWAKPQRVKSPLSILPSRSFVQYEPRGVALIIAPWNYPFHLILNPLIGAISAGCCALLKTSPMAMATAHIVEEIIRDCFEPRYVEIVHGDREVNETLLELRYDMIFFTGSPQFGRAVYKAAAEHLTPVVLELGGKSPCIVDRDANISISARRIAWGKWLNAGQTCVAPDYLLVHSSVKEQLIEELKVACMSIYGADAAQSQHYGRIISHTAFDRLEALICDQTIAFGGQCDRTQRYIAPTIIENTTPESKIMQEEIFGPLLPIITFDHLDTAIEHITSHEKPLALYYFGQSADHVLHHTSSGGVCINDTIMHLANHNLPFGGVGNSGMGRYHGRYSFEAFSNLKSVVVTPTWIDLPFRYPPFKHFGFVKRLIGIED